MNLSQIIKVLEPIQVNKRNGRVLKMFVINQSFSA